MAAAGEAAVTPAGVAVGEWVGSVKTVVFMAVTLIGPVGKDQLRLYDEGKRHLPCLRGRVRSPGRCDAGGPLTSGASGGRELEASTNSRALETRPTATDSLSA